VDRCIECGFCESNCPSRDITLTPRQRIATYKEIHRLRRIPNPTEAEKDRLKTFEGAYEYDGNATCAADGMCQEKCPVKINTGELIKSIRAEQLADQPRVSGMGTWLAKNFGLINNSVPTLLNTVSLVHKVGTALLPLMLWRRRDAAHKLPCDGCLRRRSEEGGYVNLQWSIQRQTCLKFAMREGPVNDMAAYWV
jgi:formate hydrogenlyase subunit 6/NADH:ubiquinone oxidoreductase subunit I